MVTEHLDDLRGELLWRLALTGPLHDLEGHFRLNALVQQVGHDTVTGTDDLGDRADVVVDEVLGVAQPNIGTVGKSRDLEEVAELGGLCVQKHLDSEARTHFRDSQRAGLAVDLLRGNSQNITVGTHTDNVRVRGRHVLDLKACQIL